MGAAGDFGKLILRGVLAVMMLFHGISKVVGGPGYVVGVVAHAGLPHAFAYGVYVGEVVAPLLVLIGLWTRAAAFVIAVNMAVAVALVHRGDLMHLADTGDWGLELQAMYLFTAAALVFLGAGRYSAGGANGTLN